MDREQYKKAKKLLFEIDPSEKENFEENIDVLVGPPGKDGKDGRDGVDGIDGRDGKDGKDGIDGKDGEKGERGDKGDKGDKGDDGTSVELKEVLEELRPEIIKRLPVGGGSKPIRLLNNGTNISTRYADLNIKPGTNITLTSADNDTSKWAEITINATQAASIVTGTGTTNTIPKFTASGTIGNSSITDNGTVVASTLPLNLPVGTVGAPSLYLSTDSTTGLYRPAANQLAIARSGVQRLLLNGSSNFILTAADASTNALRINIGATGFGQTAKGIFVNGGTFGTASSLIGYDYAAPTTGTENHIGYRSTLGGALGVGFSAINGNTGFSATGASNVLSADTFTNGITLTANATNNQYIQFNGLTKNDFTMFSNGAFSMTGALVTPRLTFGRMENGIYDSEDMNAATWTKTNITVTANNFNAPDGSINTADSLVTTGAATLSQTSAHFATTASKTYTFTAWINPIASNVGAVSVRIDSGNETGTTNNFNFLQTGWSLQSFSQTFTAGSTGSPKIIIAAPTGWTFSVWGVSLTEASTQYQGYVPTTGSAGFAVDYGASINGTLLLGSNTSTKQIIRAGESQSGNLFEIQNKSAAVLASFTSTGTFKPLTGTTTLLPIQMTSGTLLTTALAGGVEFLTDKFYGTITTGAARKEFIQGDNAITDAVNLVFGTTTGTKIGTATTQKLGFWNATPIVQPTTAVAASTLVGNAGTTLTDTDTFDGYTLKQVVAALRAEGLLA